MGFFRFPNSIAVVVVFGMMNLFNFGFGARKLASLYEAPPMAIRYHNGALLQGYVPVSILWYGNFTAPQKAIVLDFFLSLGSRPKEADGVAPAVSRWWNTVQVYMKRAGKKDAKVILAKQITDDKYSIGKFLQKPQISKLSQRAGTKYGGVTLVLTAEDVAVEGFCMSSCGFHDWNHRSKSAFIWVGNSVSQCPGQCAWPFHQPIYGPQTPPLQPPNADVGIDGMIINIATLLAGTATNPFGNGYFLGSPAAPLEVATACPGVYGKGAYPGYPGDLLQDDITGGSYNAAGVGTRKYLLPALYDPVTSRCSTLV
ncbi:protein PHOSPHATE-INDUCED 1-like [Benincasa hispida]|uniref:protein PHOSPHATE-INDUCED 1-like n=1 Tax=Benincasa hispida TaxID=102211 RepID=UPI0019008AE4|nr:protein PHOSPHATE-INDUCED 1-like [Benincasa hispida]